jgi:predicted DNA-binding protein with PD1-like motif
MNTKAWLVSVPLFFLIAAEAIGQDAKPPKPKFFPGSHIQEVYRISLDRDDLVLESILEAIKKYDIKDGAVLTGVGSVQKCTYHAVNSMGLVPTDIMVTVEGPTEILNVDGVIANGDTHIHLTLSNFSGATGGHLEKGCRVLYRAELTIVKFSGTPLAFKPNREGVPLLQEK